LDIVKSPA
jgi:hypothetical protein